MATRNDVERAVRALPGHSVVIARLLTLLGDGTADAKELAALVSADPALLVNVLRVANSPMLGCRSHVSEPVQAVALLGDVSLRAVAVAAMAKRTLPSAEWNHALSAGAAAAVLARRVGMPTQAAYAAGLLHDIGRVVQRQLVGHLLVTRDVHQVPDLEDERRQHHLDHTEFGRIALEVLGFPEDLIDAVGSHHDEGGLDGRPLAAAVAAANHLAHVLDEPRPRPERVELLRASLATLGLPGVEIDELVADTRLEAGQLAQLVLS